MNPTPDSHVAPPFDAEDAHSGDLEIVYRSDQIIVANGSIHIGRRRYPIDRMRHLRIVRIRYRQAHASAKVLAFVSIVAWARITDALSLNVILAGGAIAVVPILLAAFGTRRRRQRAMVADFHGLPTLVIRDKDPQQFERVVRAILAARQ